MNSKTDVVLIYPYFHHEPAWRKLWLFPPLGLGYLAATLLKNGVSVKILDGTFMSRRELIKRAEDLAPEIVGIYCMVTMREDALHIARALKNEPGKPLLVAGGPFPTSEPGIFIKDFDAVVLGEGEETMLEISKRHLAGDDLSGIPGLMQNLGTACRREFIEDLDTIPHPPRELFTNLEYMQYWQKKFGYTCAPIITTRGCPYNCDYCARPVFGNRYRERSVLDVADEIEEAGLVHGDDAGVRLERNGRSRTWRGADHGDLAEDLARADPMQLLLRAVDLLREADETGNDDEEFIALAALGENEISALIGGDMVVRIDAPFRAQARRCHTDRPPGSRSDPAEKHVPSGQRLTSGLARCAAP